MKKHSGRHVYKAIGGGEKEIWFSKDKKSQLGTIHAIKKCVKCGKKEDDLTIIAVIRNI